LEIHNLLELVNSCQLPLLHNIFIHIYHKHKLLYKMNLFQFILSHQINHRSHRNLSYRTINSSIYHIISITLIRCFHHYYEISSISNSHVQLSLTNKVSYYLSQLSNLLWHSILCELCISELLSFKSNISTKYFEHFKTLPIKGDQIITVINDILTNCL